MEGMGEAMGDMEAQAADEKTPLNETKESELHRTIDNADVCCCCICQCQEERTRDLSCFGCFPIKCGLVATGILTEFLIVATFAELFYFILDDHIHWWYVLVSILLLIPAIIAAMFQVKWFNWDNFGTRTLVRTSFVQVIISYTLIAIWNIIYFNAWYKHGEVTAGGPEVGYFTLTKKQYLFWSLFSTLVIDSFYAYFICVAQRYKNALRGDEEKDAEEAKRKNFD
jgi:hypothetical protein